jgi:L-aspartate oxidase
MSEYIENNFDTVVIGSGIAGLNLARKLAQAGQRVFICSKEAITEGSSKYAQGGVAVVSPLNPEDNLDSHIQDTLSAGKGLCNEEVVRKILEISWDKVNELIKLGVEFDKHFNIEGSHGYKRIMHVGDATGRAIVKPLVDNISRNLNIFISQGTEALSLIKDKSINKVIGVRLGLVSGDEFDVWADNIVLATGGLAALYQDYTCPGILTGDGVALAYDAGAKVENLEFIQFHPTVFKTKAGKNFLISEALRGAGATLRNSEQELFANKYHPDAELATRDIVSRAICSEMKNTESDYVFIDARHLGEEFLRREFPTIYSFCLANGFNLSQDLLPVRPAAHYSVGGIKTDIHGRTNVHGLFALGECASNGFHGANRLASNSLLECIVIPDLVAEMILADEFNLTNKKLEEDESNIEYCSNYFTALSYDEIQSHKALVDNIRSVMTKNLGVERREKSVRAAVKYLETLDDCKERSVALLIANSALLRKESRGVHFRVDSPRPLSIYERPTIMSKESGTIGEARRIRITK